MGCGGSKSGDISSEANSPTAAERLRHPPGKETDHDHDITAVEIGEDKSSALPSDSNEEKKLAALERYKLTKLAKNPMKH